jgi:hypothetical protein
MEVIPLFVPKLKMRVTASIGKLALVSAKERFFSLVLDFYKLAGPPNVGIVSTIVTGIIFIVFVEAVSLIFADIRLGRTHTGIKESTPVFTDFLEGVTSPPSGRVTSANIVDRVSLRVVSIESLETFIKSPGIFVPHAALRFEPCWIRNCGVGKGSGNGGNDDCGELHGYK